MDKVVIFISFLCFLTLFNTSTCLKTEEQWPKHHIKRDLPARGPIETSSPATELSGQPSGSRNSLNNSQTSLQQQPNLLGVNGTGQRKDLSLLTTSTPVLAATISTTPLKEYKSDNNSYISENGFTLDIDETDEDTELAKNHNVTNTKEDYHVYYNSKIVKDKEMCEKHRKALSNLTVSNMLSHSYRRAMTIKLSFDFPFYGHPVRNVTVATGGFLYTGEHVHSWLAATQYIAPLMANFDTSQSNDSFVKYSDNGTAFTVLWEKVNLQDNARNGTFTFSATLFKNGDITFAYYSVPVDVQAIHNDKHPVKVGLSDAYIIDKTIFFARRKTIYEYHRVNFESGHIGNDTLIFLQAQITCLNYTDCQSCTEAYSELNCLWCPTINRCSTGTDRQRQEWLHKGCDASKITHAGICPKLGEKGNDYKGTTDEPENMPPAASTEAPIDKSSSVTQSSRINNRKMNLDEHDNDTPAAPDHVNAEHAESHHSKSVKTTLGFLIPIGLILSAALWAFYAYRNPHSKSGQFLIQYRPSQWGWRRGEAHYTAAVQQ